MTNRKKCLVSPAVGDLLVKQVAHELRNHSLYKSIANFFSVEAIVDLEEFFNKQADGENGHHNEIMSYLSDADYKFSYPTVLATTEPINDYIAVFEVALEREILTTQMLYAIYEQAMSEKDYMTAIWLLNGLIKEQIEEENTSRMAISIMNQDADIFVRAEKVLELLG